jgi:hypothetical protein
MIKKDISQITVETIKQTGMKPAPKAMFTFSKTIFWLLVGITIAVGSLSFAVILFLLINNDWSLYGRLGPGFILKTLPYFWFVFLALFIFLGEYYYKKTTFGYRYRFLTIITAYALVTVLLGSVLYASGFGGSIEEKLHTNIPAYRSVTFNQQNIWSQPEKGLLSGTILSVGSSTIEIVDFNNTKWSVEIHNTLIRDRVELYQNETIKIIGTSKGDGLFSANEIRPWRGNQRMMR